jgi:hypothetical protein
MDVIFDVSAVPLTDEEINAILSKRLPMEEITIAKVELTQEMIAAQPQLPDPVFSRGDVVPCTYDAGAQLNCLDAYETGFKTMIQEMFDAGPELKLTKEGMEQLLQQR